MFNYHVYEVVIGYYNSEKKQDETITYEVIAENISEAIDVAEGECWSGGAISAKFLRDIPEIKEINRVSTSKDNS